MFSARDRALMMKASSSALRCVTARAGSHRLLSAPAVPPQQIGGGCGLYDHRQPAPSQHRGPARGTSWREGRKAAAAGGGNGGGAIAVGRCIVATTGITGRRTLSTTAAPAPAVASAPRYVCLG